MKKHMKLIVGATLVLAAIGVIIYLKNKKKTAGVSVGDAITSPNASQGSAPPSTIPTITSNPQDTIRRLQDEQAGLKANAATKGRIDTDTAILASQKG